MVKFVGFDVQCFGGAICGCLYGGELKADAAQTHWPRADYQGSRMNKTTEI